MEISAWQGSPLKASTHASAAQIVRVIREKLFLVSQWLSGLFRITHTWPVTCNTLSASTIQFEAHAPSFTERNHRARRLYTLTFQESRTAAYGFFPDESQLENVLRALNVAGFENEDLCVLIASEHPIAERIRGLDCTKTHDLPTDASPERVIAWLSSYGAVVIPDVGFFVGSRQYMQALALPVELLATSERGVFAGLGISPSVAARYEGRMRDKSSFVFVSCDDLAQSEWARELLSTMGAEEVSLLRQESDSQTGQGGTKPLAN
jgi:hypothetical protein